MKLTNKANNIPDCCWVNRCRRGNCSVNLDGVSSKLILDLDCKALGQQQNKRCDYLLIGKINKKTWLVSIELKGGRVGSITDLGKQLQTGTDMLDELFPKGAPHQFIPLLATNGMNKKQRYDLRKKNINFRNKTVKIVKITCRGRIDKLLDGLRQNDYIKHP